MSVTLTVNGKPVDRLPGDLQQSVALPDDIAEKLCQYLDKNAEDERFQRFINGDGAERVPEVVPDVPHRQTEMERRFEALEDDSPSFVKVETNGFEFWAQKLDYTGHIEFAMLTERNPDRSLRMATKGALKRIAFALLMVGVVRGENDATPAFTEAEAWKWLNGRSKAQRGVVSDLTDAVLALNPDLIPDLPEDAASDLSEAQKKIIEPSTELATSGPPNGLPGTASIDAPQLSPSFSTAAVESLDTAGATSA